MDETNAPRRFTEEEVERILQRAAEMDAERPAGGAGSEGMTLAELEQIGVEAGLRPELLRRAVRELDRSPVRGGDSAAPFVGAPVVIRFEREFDGELDPRALESLIPELRRAADGTGHPAIVGSTLSWESTDNDRLRSLGVTVSSTGGRTRIWIEERLNRLAGSLFGGIVGGFGAGVGIGVGVGVGVGALGSVVFAAGFPVALLVGSYLVARGLFRSRYAERREALSRLMERMVAEVERSRRQGGSEEGGRSLPPGDRETAG